MIDELWNEGSQKVTGRFYYKSFLVRLSEVENLFWGSYQGSKWGLIVSSGSQIKRSEEVTVRDEK